MTTPRKTRKTRRRTVTGRSRAVQPGAGGRPRKHSEPMRTRSYYLPEWAVAVIDARASGESSSASEALTSILSELRPSAAAVSSRPPAS